MSSAALATHFFLKYNYGVPASAVIPAAAPVSAEQTPLWLVGNQSTSQIASQWRLLGVITQGTGTLSLALLQQANENRARVVHIGQSLPDGSVLSAVELKQVTLNNQGTIQTLQLESPAGSTAVNMGQRGMDINSLSPTQNQPNIPINIQNNPSTNIGISNNLVPMPSAASMPAPAVSNALSKNTASTFQNNRAIKQRLTSPNKFGSPSPENDTTNTQ